ncbi:alpha-L-fucosidase 2-like [Chenopodium quinoa]|uniref:alpha-L-fucosidase 2-like n=1 Tax=Chenopodium quinoa TaxID=63459 RepID=UPI000B77DEB6|nr:alpha-L-fucosidase 2-like [Chenopodium quinoa]
MDPLQLSLLLPLCLFLSFSLLILGHFGAMEERGDWGVSRKPWEKELWKPSTSLVMGDEESRPLKIIFKRPARNWTDALPIGNGRFGAMVHGGVSSEIINLSDDTLWTGIPGNYTDPNAPKALANVRKLVDTGKYSEATAFADKELSGDSSDAYQLLGDLILDFEDHNSTHIEHMYHRELDLDTATVTVRYSVGDVEFTREHFASNPDQVIVTKISSSKQGALSFIASLDSKLDHHSYTNDKNQIIMEGSCSGYPKGIQFSLVLNLQISGVGGIIHHLEGQKIRVEKADSAVILLMASSSFNGPFTKPSDSKKNPTSEALSRMNSVYNIPYSTLYARHLDDYQKLFHRVSLQL